MNTQIINDAKSSPAAKTAIQRRLEKVRERILAASIASGRDEGAVTLIAVSKTFPALSIQQAVDLGQIDFGENYAQEAVGKAFELEQYCIENIETGQFTGPNFLRWHFIGPLQSNKSRQIAETMHWVHSVDSLKLMRRLSQQRPEKLPPLNICIQINISDETQKSGVSAEAALELCHAANEFPNLRLRGLMALPAPAISNDDPAQPFIKMAELYNRLNQAGHKLDALSMGMSDDFELAIAHGATHLRVGSAIFGRR